MIYIVRKTIKRPFQLYVARFFTARRLVTMIKSRPWAITLLFKKGALQFPQYFLKFFSIDEYLVTLFSLLKSSKAKIEFIQLGVTQRPGLCKIVLNWNPYFSLFCSVDEEWNGKIYRKTRTKN